MIEVIEQTLDNQFFELHRPSSVVGTFSTLSLREPTRPEQATAQLRRLASGRLFARRERILTSPYPSASSR